MKMSLQLIKFRFDRYLKFGFIKHSLILLTIVTTVVDIVNYHKHCNGWHQYYESVTNTTTTIESLRYGFGGNLPMVWLFKCIAYIIVEAVYNLILLIIIIKEDLKGVSTFVILELSLIFYSKITRVSFHRTNTITINEYFLWYFYFLNMFYYWRVLKYKIIPKGWEMGVEEAPRVAICLWPLFLLYFICCMFF